MNETERNWTPKQEKALASLLTEPTIEGVAKVVGISKTTLYQWLKEPAFKAALDEARALLFTDNLSLLKASLKAGVEALRLALTDPDATVANKITAGKTLIELALRANEQLEIEQRLAALESQMTAQE